MSLFRNTIRKGISDKLQRFYLDNSSEIFIYISDDLKILYVNNAFCRIYGCGDKSLIEKSISEVFDQQSTEKISAIKSGRDDDSYGMELALKNSGGEIRWIKVMIHKRTDRILMIGRDITEEKFDKEKKNEQVRNIEEDKMRFLEILNNIGDGVITVNDKGEIVYVNKQTVDLLGFTPEEMIGEYVWKKIAMVNQNGQELDIAARPIRMALFTRKRIYENTHLYRSKDGRLIPVAVTATPLVIRGLVVGGVDVFRDITKERQIDRMKTEFISLASHQLRTPLSATKWFAELILDDTKNMNEEQVGLIRNIYTSNQRMIDLVNALLNISRIESGRIIIDPKPTDLRKLVEEVIVELTPKIRDKKHNVILSIHEGLPEIRIDPKLIRNVYMNLLTNSIKYTREGGEITVMISKRDEEIVSQVSDNGLGIPENQKQHIFEKFFRSSNIIKVETDGTGLGLYLAKSIVESSGGRIWFESEEYKGTTFWFTLPLRGSPAKKGEVTIDS